MEEVREKTHQDLPLSQVLIAYYLVLGKQIEIM
jgi:hypothetical protein